MVTDGDNLFRAKYTQSSNSWSLLPSLPSATDPHVATTGGANLAVQARHTYRATGSAPYAIVTATGLVPGHSSFTTESHRNHRVSPSGG